MARPWGPGDRRASYPHNLENTSGFSALQQSAPAKSGSEKHSRGSHQVSGWNWDFFQQPKVNNYKSHDAPLGPRTESFLQPLPIAVLLRWSWLRLGWGMQKIPAFLIARLHWYCLSMGNAFPFQVVPSFFLDLLNIDSRNHLSSGECNFCLPLKTRIPFPD